MTPEQRWQSGQGKRFDKLWSRVCRCILATYGSKKRRKYKKRQSLINRALNYANKINGA